MASSELMPSTASTSSRKRDLRGNPISRPDPKSGFHHFQSQQLVLDGNENVTRELSISSAVSVDGFFRSKAGGMTAGGSVSGKESSMLNAEITLLDAAGAIEPITDAPAVRKKTAEEVWSEIVAGGKSEEIRRVEAKEEPKEEMMTLEDFLVKAGAVDEAALMTDMEGEVKYGSGLSGEVFSLDAAYMSRQGSLDSVGMMGYGDEASGLTGIGRRRSASIFEPLDKAAQQRQKRMIKNRESAARSRERKQAYQNELESMAVRLEEENELLLKEKAEWTKARRKMLMEKIIPVEEKRRPARCLRRVHSMLW